MDLTINSGFYQNFSESLKRNLHFLASCPDNWRSQASGFMKKPLSSHLKLPPEHYSSFSEGSIDAVSYFMRPHTSDGILHPSISVGMKGSAATSSYVDGNCDQESNFFLFNSLSQPPLNCLGSSQFSVDPVYSDAFNTAGLDFERDSSTPALSAFVSKLVEENDHEGIGIPTSSEQAVLEDWCYENDSIGQLAIKLADLALINENESCESGATPACTEEGTGNLVKKVSTGHDQRKKNVLPKTACGVYQQSKRPKACRKAGSDKKHNQAFRGRGRTPHQHPFSSYEDCKTQVCSKKSSDPPAWVNFSIGTKATSLSSSNSSLHKKSNHLSTAFPKTKAQSNKPRLENTGNSTRRHYPRKTFSSCSSNSSGGRGKYTECVFCKTNGETTATYRSHVLKDNMGRTVCQVLQKYVCPLCGATGINAHTLKYCPKNENPPMVATMTTLKAMRSSTGRKRYGLCSGQARHVQLGFHHSLLPAYK